MAEREKSNKEKQKISKIIEEKTKLVVFLPDKTIDVSKKLNVFYNPVMKCNRDISLLVVNKFLKENSKIALPLAGSGIRGIRILNELNKTFDVYFNDLNPTAVKIIKKNLKLNKIECKNIFNKYADIFLLENKHFDYIDIDPFGTPNPFLDSAVKSLKINGILAVTATDTSALCGTYPKAGLRKYWAIVKKNDMMHETGLRILIRKIQLIGAQYERALIPMLSYSKDHYMRIFFKCLSGKEKINDILKNHKMFKETGPMWFGELGDSKIIKNLNSDDKFLNLLGEEYKIKTVGFYNIPKICKKEKISFKIKMNEIINILKKKKFKASRTHFNPQGIKSDCELKDILNILNKSSANICQKQAKQVNTLD